MTSDADRSADVRLADGLTAAGARAMAAITAQNHRTVAARVKSDGSRVTAADEAAEAIILAELRALAPAIAIVSEESARVRPASSTFFLIDPLDGTAEFLAGRDEYTINIALVRDGIPVIGLIAQPATGIVWRGIVGRGAERLTLPRDGAKPREVAPIRARAWPDRGRIAAVSRSHYEKASAEFLARFAPIETLACGSALKFARIAEGLADVYPRLAPTSEWDVAAGHALVAAAGGTVTTPEDKPLSYGGRDDFRVGGFIAWGDPAAARRIARQTLARE